MASRLSGDHPLFHKHRLLYSLLLGSLLLAGCASSGHEKTAAATPAMPPQWQASSTQAAVTTGWINEFGDPALSALVDKAIVDSFSLQAAAARVRAALQQAQISGAVRKPQISGAFDASRSHSGTPRDITNNQFTLSLNASWEADLWGRLSHRSRAAIEAANAQASELQAARLSLAANVARSWFGSIEAMLQRDLSRERVSNFEHTLDIISERYRQGIGDALDVRLARENLATARVSLLQRQRQLDSAVRTLQALSGRYPDGKQTIGDKLPDLTGPIPAGLPSQLLERRPDLVAARHRLESSLQNRLDRSRNYLPDIRLSTSGGNISEQLSRLLDWDQLFWNIAAKVTQPIFQGGHLKAERKLAQAQEEEAVANYAQAVLTAFQEVESLLAARPLLEQQWQAQAKATEEAHQSAELALEKYRSGLTGITTLLDAQRRWFLSQSALLSTQRAVIENRIDLHLALGGDFQATPTDSKTP